MERECLGDIASVQRVCVCVHVCGAKTFWGIHRLEQQKVSDGLQSIVSTVDVVALRMGVSE